MIDLRRSAPSVGSKLPALVAVLALATLGVVSPIAAQRRDAEALLDAAVAVIGGRDRLESVRTLRIEGMGSEPNLGHQMSPEAELLVWLVPEFRRDIDLVNDRMIVEYNRRPAFPAVFDNFRSFAGLDGVVAWTRSRSSGMPLRSPADAVPELRRQLLHHPVAALRAALASGSRVSNARTIDGREGFDIGTAQGETLTLTLDGTTGLPERVLSQIDHPNLGDVVLETAFSGYEDQNGLRLPRRIRSSLDGYPQLDIGVVSNTVNEADIDLRAPESVTADGASADGANEVVVQAVAPGIWYLTGAAIPSVVVEFADHLTLIEAPISEARTLAVIARARGLRPDKPLRDVIVSHHHFDHAAGLRAAVAEGLTIVTHRRNRAWFEDLARRPHRLRPDRLERNPQPLDILAVDDSLVLADPSMELALYHLRGSPHGDGILIAYLPGAGILVEADVWNPGAPLQPHVRHLAAEIERRDLDVERILPLHGQAETQPYSTFVELVASLSGMDRP